jgi:hypothetical protein
MCEGARLPGVPSDRSSSLGWLESCHKLFKMREWGFSPCNARADTTPEVPFSAAGSIAALDPMITTPSPVPKSEVQGHPQLNVISREIVATRQSGIAKFILDTDRKSTTIWL